MNPSILALCSQIITGNEQHTNYMMLEKTPAYRAIAYVETGDVYTKIGSKGEITQYQIMPRIYDFYKVKMGHRGGYYIPKYLATQIAYELQYDNLFYYRMRVEKGRLHFEAKSGVELFFFLWHFGPNKCSLTKKEKAALQRYVNVYEELNKQLLKYNTKCINQNSQ